MKGHKTLDSVCFEGFLSFQEDSDRVKLEPLNVIIGSNASGKSNFLHGFRMLRGIAGDLNKVFRELGGSGNTFHRGKEKSEFIRISCDLTESRNYFQGIEDLYQILIVETATDKWQIAEEQFIEGVSGEYFHLDVFIEQDVDHKKNSGLSQIAHDLSIQELVNLKKALSQIWQNSFDYENCVRNVKNEQQSDYPRNFPLESFKNLGVVLSEIEKTPHFRDALYGYLKRVIPRFERLHIDPLGSQLMIYFYEKGITDPIPATRLSDGTLHLLCLLTVLLHPKPPPIICLEEPDLGLHPDAIHIIAEVLIEASKRTQIICTTHSPLLVSAIGDQHPEAIVVCERDEKGTKLTRLDAEKMEKWLEEFSLGDLWIRGEIGGGITDA